jgi:diacylglycerol kinase family enzyme
VGHGKDRQGRQRVAGTKAGGKLSSRKSTIIIVNPAAGGGAFLRRRQNFNTLVRKLCPEAEVAVSSNPGEFLELARISATRFRTMAVAGGDSSLTLALNAIGSSFPRLAFIPLGSCNDIARHFGIASVADALRKITIGKTLALPLGRISAAAGSRLFVGQCSTGAAVQLNREIEKLKSESFLYRKLPPFFSALRSFTSARPRFMNDYRVTLERKTLEDRLALLAVSLISYFSCGLRLFETTPGSPQGLMLFGLRSDSLATFLKLYLKLRRDPGFISGEILREQERARLTIGSATPFLMQCDGELFSEKPHEAYELELLPAAADFII